MNDELNTVPGSAATLSGCIDIDENVNDDIVPVVPTSVLKLILPVLTFSVLNPVFAVNVVAVTAVPVIV
jgi:hypothetical protein